MNRHIPGLRAALALVALAASALATPGSAQTATEADHVWNPQAYGITGILPPSAPPKGSVGAVGGQTTPLPTAPATNNTCNASASVIRQSDCQIAGGTYGFGSRTTTWSDGCGGQYTTQDACEVSCQPIKSQIGANGACQPSNGSYGPGSFAQQFTNGCGTNYTQYQSCCVPGRVQVGGSYGCSPYNGVYGAGLATQQFTDGCGYNYTEQQSCCRPGNVQASGTSGCYPYNGAYGQGYNSTLFVDGCGGSHYQYGGCCVPRLILVYQTGCGPSNGSYGAGIVQLAYDDQCGGGLQTEIPCNTPIPCVDFDRADCHDSAHQ